MAEELIRMGLDYLVSSTLKSRGYTLEKISDSVTLEKIELLREFEEFKRCFYLEKFGIHLYFIREYTVAIFPYLITNYVEQNLLAKESEEFDGRVIYYSFLPKENQEGDGMLIDSNVRRVEKLGPKEAVDKVFSIIYHGTLNQPHQWIPEN